MNTSTLDTAKLAKLRALMERGATEGERDAALRDALAPFEDEGNMWGYRGLGASMTPEMQEAVGRAVRIPDTVPEALEAFLAYERRETDRHTLDPDWQCYGYGEVWRMVLERALDTLRTPTAQGIAARLDWMAEIAKQETYREAKKEADLLAALRDDFAAFMASQGGRVRATRQERRAEVLDLMRKRPDLSDREIARRSGVSPQTVGNWRRKAG